MIFEHRAKLLIVDDRPEQLLILQRLIEKEEQLIYSAISAEAALSLLLEHEFALAIIDVIMPGINGFELAELMRGMEKTRQIPIIFVSASNTEPNYTFKGYDAAAVDFLHKPLHTSALKSKVALFVALHQQRHDLKQKTLELEKTHQQLHRTQTELQQALTMRDEFMSLVSHELRTPLNTLHIENQIRQLQFKREEISAFSREKFETMVARDSRQIQSMICLLSDINDISRIQQGQLTIHPAQLNLSQLLHQIIADLSCQAEAADSSFALEIAEDIEGSWDPLRIEQIIVNLLSNALRYSDSKPVAIALKAKPTQVEVTVRDQGIGIAEAAQEKIFEKFERAETQKVNNTMGMGLYIARQLAEAHCGTLQVESRLGEGAIFRLTLPR